MSSPSAPLTLDSPIAHMWAVDIQVKREPDPWRALNSAEILTFASTANAQKILQLAKAVTPDAQLINGPGDDPNFIEDAIDTAVTYMVMHEGVDYYPWAIKATYGAQKLRTYVAGLVREHQQNPNTTRLVVTVTSGVADYDWA
jgi:hypothetical protein